MIISVHAYQLPKKGSSQLIPIELNSLIPVITGSTDHSLTTLKGGKSSIASLSWAKEIDGSEPMQVN